MKLTDWLNRGSAGRRATMASYKQGLGLAASNNASAAIEAYTAAIEHDEAPEDVIAMALYNRALLLAASSTPERAIADLKIVRAMPNAPFSVKVAAKRRLGRMQHQTDVAASSRLNSMKSDSQVELPEATDG